MIKELCFVTSNENKAKEAEAILDLPIKIVNKEIKEIQSLNLEEVVRQKATDAYKEIKKPLFVEDVGIYVEAWNGFPGPFTRYLLESGGPDLFLRMMEHEQNRNVVAKVAIGFTYGKQIRTFTGEVKGKISGKVKGSRGWAWDFIFIPEGYDKTFAELGPKIKNIVSARHAALEKFKKFLQS